MPDWSWSSAVAKLNQVGSVCRSRTSEVRVGIATGLVVVGDAVAGSDPDRDAVVGEAANLAARLQGMAEPNTVVVSEVTRQLAAERFEYRDLGQRELKGFATPMSVYQVIGQREVTRLEARGAARTPFVDREDEIAILLDRWRRATSQTARLSPWLVRAASASRASWSRQSRESDSRPRRRRPLWSCSTRHIIRTHRSIRWSGTWCGSPISWRKIARR